MAWLANAILSGYSSRTIGNCIDDEFKKILSILPFEYPLKFKVFMNEYIVRNGNIQLNYH